jgi:hypothetical protein
MKHVRKEKKRKERTSGNTKILEYKHKLNYLVHNIRYKFMLN